MDCNTTREAWSSTLDGETLGIDSDAMQAHLDGCAECAQWTEGASAIHMQFRIAEAPSVPDLRPRILHAIGQHDPARARNIRDCRIILGICAVIQLAACLSVIAQASGTAIHLDHELGSWDAALGAGLLFAAFRPARAWGMLPLVAAISFALFLTAVIDVATGHTTLASESAHVVELFGLLVLAVLARLYRSTPGQPNLPTALHLQGEMK